MLVIKPPSFRESERIVWQAQAGESLWKMDVTGWFVASFLVVGAIGLGYQLSMAPRPWAVLAFFSPLVIFLGAGLLVWVRPRLGPVYFLTNERLVVWDLMRQRHVSHTLSEIEHVGRHHRRVRVGRGLLARTETRVTSEIDVVSSGMKTTFGPLVHSDDFLASFDGVMRDRRYELDVLPDVRGRGEAPAEEREDLLFVARPTNGGPLFIGPRTVVRWAAPLPGPELGRLFASAAIADLRACEEAVLAHARDASASLADECPCASATPRWDDGAIHLRMDETSTVVRLADADAARAERYLRSSEAGVFR